MASLLRSHATLSLDWYSFNYTCSLLFWLLRKLILITISQNKYYSCFMYSIFFVQKFFRIFLSFFLSAIPLDLNQNKSCCFSLSLVIARAFCILIKIRELRFKTWASVAETQEGKLTKTHTIIDYFNLKLFFGLSIHLPGIG